MARWQLRKTEATNKELTADTGLAKSSASQKVRRLVQLGLVKFDIEDDMKRNFALSPNLNVSKLMADASSIPYSTTDRL